MYQTKYSIYVFILLFFISACSPGYVVRSAYEGSKILINRQKIKNVIADQNLSESEKSKLQLISAARLYAIDLGLDPQGSFTYYTKIDRDVVAWILMASLRDRFEHYQWWFPFVGHVPYKGFFERIDAEREAKILQEKGYETYIRPTIAYSTLGWFDDPILSPALKLNDSDLVNLVLHESFHSTYWFENDVFKNEGFANYYGHTGAVNFFKEKYKLNLDPKTKENYMHSLHNLQQEEKIAVMLEALYQELDQIYKSNLNFADKITSREQVFNKHINLFKKDFPNIKILQTINNAEILNLRIYLKDFLLAKDEYEKNRSFGRH